ncbi:type IV pilus assembly protein PilN [Glaciecola punicea ACAM 611]|jgi:type IV pilus assembly protein PilN|uniref:Type IV pilus assembly protein PilN n=1 Tax=Glaciecola punicea ACAM 611 TaxID=1121923 RepID=H5TF05_9ALTE|nr:PilN domain-containing protein [Glaciecola punicea]GAB56932.1 type IV pilus assembly protein PilN [Glaciecola punicea ACAM 611]
MAKINLLPWREALRQTHKKHYIGSLVGVSVAVFALFWVIGQIIDQQVRNQNSRNNYLSQQIEVLDRQISRIREISNAKEEIGLRMALIEQLQISKNLTPIIFDELAKIMPAGVAFDTMSRSDKQIKITGMSDSNNRLSSFMRALDLSEVFVDAEISSIVADKTGLNAVSDFDLTFSISPKYGPVEIEQLDAQEE